MNHCTVDDCDKPVAARGWCFMHYQRWRRHGDVETVKVVKSRNGDRWPGPGGYMLLWRPEHPNALASGVIAEHRFLMSEILGRPLLEGENVHHKNGVRHDNRPENLELWVTYQPAGQRVPDLLEWAAEIVRRYA